MICAGLAGPILDVADLLRGKTLLVAHAADDESLELRQISSSVHEDDLDNVPPMDAINILERMSKTEEFLLSRNPSPGWVTMEKQRQDEDHGFQRIIWRRSEPERCKQDQQWKSEHGASVPGFLELHNPVELTVGEFRGGVIGVLPDRGKTLEAILYFRPLVSGWLHQLSGDHRWGLAQAIRELTGALLLELSRLALPERYHWSLHCGPEQEVFTRISVPEVAMDAENRRQWCEQLKDHLGLG